MARSLLVAAAVLCAVAGVALASNDVEDAIRAARFDSGSEGDSYRKWFKAENDDDDDDHGDRVIGGHFVRSVMVRPYNTFNLTELALPGVVGGTFTDGWDNAFSPFSGGFYVEHRHIDDDDDDDDDTSATSSDLDHHTHTVYGITGYEFDVSNYNYVSYVEADTDNKFNVRAVAVVVGRSGTPYGNFHSGGNDEVRIEPRGLVRAGDGHFWVADSFYPSLLKVNVEHGKATIVKKFVPAGSNTNSLDHDTQVEAAFPEALGSFDDFSAFTAIAISRDRSKLFILCAGAGDRDQDLGATRLFVFSTEHERLIGEYVVVQDTPASFNQPVITGVNRQTIEDRDRRFEGLAYIDDEHLLVLEVVTEGGRNNRNGYSRVCEVSLSHATNIVGQFDETSGSPSPASLLDGASVTALPPVLKAAEKVKVLDIPYDGDSYYPTALQILDDRYVGISSTVYFDDEEFDVVSSYRLDHKLA